MAPEGFGTVYLGFDDRLKRNVAIKVPTRVLTGLELDKFLEEAQRLAQLRHSGIVTVFDVGEFDGRCYIVSDYLKGLSLSDWMKSKPYGWREAASITAKLADALAHAHSNGTIHRDIKPSNVILRRTPASRSRSTSDTLEPWRILPAERSLLD